LYLVPLPHQQASLRPGRAARTAGGGSASARYAARDLRRGEVAAEELDRLGDLHQRLVGQEAWLLVDHVVIERTPKVRQRLRVAIVGEGAGIDDGIRTQLLEQGGQDPVVADADAGENRCDGVAGVRVRIVGARSQRRLDHCGAERR
jgi:hypothetical protein